MALLNLGEDPWLTEYDACEKLRIDIMEQLSKRDNHPKHSDKYSKISGTIRIRLKQYNNQVTQLKEKLHAASYSHSITNDEKERRTRQIELLTTRGIQMQKIFNDQTYSNNSRERSQLMGSDWRSRDDEMISVDPNQYSVEQLRSQQQSMLQDQERGLENLSQIIARQKTIAQTISSEVDYQNDIIEDLGDHIVRTDDRVRNETSNIGVIDRKDNTCIYWVVIIILFICIITVVCI